MLIVPTGDKDENQPIVCELCNVACVGRFQYEQHLKGAKHRQRELEGKSYAFLISFPLVGFCGSAVTTIFLLRTVFTGKWLCRHPR